MIHAPQPLCGIFVGGRARRMGGQPKGLLINPATGQTLVTHLRAMAERLGLRCVLVGNRPEYTDIDLPMLADDPPAIGPLGGLSALLAYANGPALALSCDLPYLSQSFVSRILSVDARDHDVVAPVRDGRFEPLCALYYPSVQLVLQQALADGERSFQRLLARLRVATLPLSSTEHHELDDWDSPDDIPT